MILINKQRKHLEGDNMISDEEIRSLDEQMVKWVKKHKEYLVD